MSVRLFAEFAPESGPRMFRTLTTAGPTAFEEVPRLIEAGRRALRATPAPAQPRGLRPIPPCPAGVFFPGGGADDHTT